MAGGIGLAKLAKGCFRSLAAQGQPPPYELLEFGGDGCQGNVHGPGHLHGCADVCGYFHVFLQPHFRNLRRGHVPC